MADYIFIQKSKQLQADLAQSVEQRTTMNKKLNKARSEVDLWKKKFESADSQCQTESDDLKSKIEAFAKQAAACEQIKHKLHIK